MKNYHRLIAFGALVAATGFVLSGPVSFFIVTKWYPQPAWYSPALFAEHYNAMQNLPYYFGFLLVGGVLMVATGLYLATWDIKPEKKFALLLSFGLTLIFSMLICFNYICQTSFIHQLATHYSHENDAAISLFTMANPTSLCWSIEMWGYGILGIATWMMSEYYRERKKFIRWLLLLNAKLSILGIFLTTVDAGWVISRAGLTAYFGWNILMILIMVLIFADARKNRKWLMKMA